MSGVRIMPAGERAVVVELEPGAEVHALAAAVRERWGPAAEEVVPGERSLLVCWSAGGGERRELATALSALAEQVAGAGAPPAGGAPASLRIPVRYDGPDLDAVATATGLTVAQVIARHTAPTYTAAFIGFAPGFAYLTGGDPVLALPRRATPRVRVPAGAVAIAARYSAVYPSTGPGGWHLLGHTSLTLFDPRATPPVLIQPGMQVRFEAI